MTDYCSKTVDANGKPFVSFGFHTDQHTGCHPVLVLDPEDAKAIEALHTAYWDVPGHQVDRMAAAVRSMLTPPKIPEPTSPQRIYNAAHDPADRHCLNSPCEWHPFERRIWSRPMQDVLIELPSVVVTDGGSWDCGGCPVSPRFHVHSVIRVHSDGESTDDKYPDPLIANPYRESPPEIVEPTNRYAVVVDKDGVEWIREVAGYWRSTGRANCRWDRLCAVRVLSDGVTE